MSAEIKNIIHCDLKWNVKYIMHNYGHFAEFKNNIIFSEAVYV